MRTALRLLFASWLAALAAVTPASPGGAAAVPPSGFVGLVGRDPWYEFDATAGQPRRAFQEAMLRNIAATGAGWVRIEFHTAYDDAGVREAGQMTYAETDAYGPGWTGGHVTLGYPG
jgi:hypothetical protein